MTDKIPPLTYARHCAEIVTQAHLLHPALVDADLAAPVPSCPDWNLGQLLRHLGGALSWAETIVRTRSQEPPSDTHFRALPKHTDHQATELGTWINKQAVALSAALTDAGAGTDVWTPFPNGTTSFLARRFAHETLIHRADATLATGTPFAVAPEVAADAIQEFFDLATRPEMLEIYPERRALLGPHRTIRFTTDTTAWFIDLTGTALVCKPSDQTATATVHGTLTNLLTYLYGRGNTVTIEGDTTIVDLWRTHSTFG
ncbi:maleylpyruvate isomerase family mycothiol-dependent enzyme [Actinokineospora sp. NBRC 105648]|uniref:maleylpyruvate isomerase family mycothiol-dependent enzyme n=1 Tax=Actinokineospora sp. NBRC 105648 TaxID=3032206 RepID=UPI0024A56F9E|nr:maleylpyruvate isomerase family mycothiol-dependent enzyme [Actinokineospora sp. NBRC 105648]GLZ41765.1 hypothetical protein Acsp05_53890 [Actinokineospora sp. NBRC 105648]